MSPTGAGTSTTTGISASTWATGLLHALQQAGFRAPVTTNNIDNIRRVIGVESAGNKAGFLRDNNPWNLNTYTAAHSSLPGGHIVNMWGVNIQQFSSVQQGYAAYVNQLKANPALLSALNSNAPPPVFGAALGQSGWKGGSYANSKVFPTLTPFQGVGAVGAGSPNVSTGSPNKKHAGNPKGWFGQWVEPTLTGSIIGLKNNPLVPATNGVIGVVRTVGGLTTIESNLASGSFWKRLGVGSLGVGLVVGGVILFTVTSKTGQKTIETAGGVV